jgi:hypothetical protein
MFDIFRKAGCCLADELTGTGNQIELGTEIRLRTDREFDRVAKAFRAAADKQPAQDRSETEAVIAILEEKRVETMGHESAGYFIREWQEQDGRVRRLIADDPRYQAIKGTREKRRSMAQELTTL